MNHSAALNFIYNTGAAQTTLKVMSNSIIGTLTRTASAGALSFISCSGGSSGVLEVDSICYNNFSNITATTAGSGVATFMSLQAGTGPYYPKKIITNNVFSNINSNSSGSTIQFMQLANCGDANSGSGSVIANNIWRNITMAGSIYALGTPSSVSSTYPLEIYNNTVSKITTTGASNYVYGANIQCANAGVNFHNNRIDSLIATGSTGNVHGIYGNGGTIINIYNNYIGNLHAPLTATIAPNYLGVSGMTFATTSATTFYNVYYNTVNLNTTSSGTNFTSAGIYVNTSVNSIPSTLNLRNNIIVNNSTYKGSGYTCGYLRYPMSMAYYASTSNNNLFWAGTPGPKNVIFKDSASTYINLSDFKTKVYPRDVLSVTENPTFLATTLSNPNYLHISTAVSTQIESGAINIAGYTNDYDGDIRQGNFGYIGTGTAPDIGADEGTFPNNDLTGPALFYTNILNTVDSTTYVLNNFANISDATGVNTTSPYKPRLYFKKSTDANTYAGNTSANNGWKYVETTSATSPFSFTIDYSKLQSIVNVGNTIQYFVVAQDLVGVPNISINSGVFAAAPTNIALTSTAFPLTGTINSYSILPALNGNFHVGVAQAAPFNTLTAAVNYFNNSILTAPVTYFLDDATYSASETFPITLNPNLGSNATNIFTIKPNVGQTVSITGNSTSSILKWVGADYITLDGSNAPGGTSRNLTVQNTATTGTTTSIYMISDALGAQYNTIKNCIIKANINTLSTISAMYIGGTTINSTSVGATDFDYNTLQNNQIEKGYYGLLFNASSPSSDNFNMIGNIFGSDIAADYITNYSVYLSGTINNALFSSNTIKNMKYDGSKYAMYLTGSVTNSRITKNKIYGFGPATSAATSYFTFGIYDASTTNTNLTIDNNMLYDFITYGNTSSVYIRGIYVSGGPNKYLKLYNNSVHFTGSFANPNTGVLSACFYLSSSGSNMDIRNNIFSNATTGVSPKTYATYMASGSTNLTMDKNCYYTSGTTIGYYGVDQVNFSTWKATTQKDSNSIASVVNFLSPTDLHVSSATPSAVESTGADIVGFSTDFDGDLRPGPVGSIHGGATHYDMGADEFDGIPGLPMAYDSSTTVQYPAYIYASGVNQKIIGVRIYTSGDMSPINLTSLTFNTNGTTTPSYLTKAKVWYTGSLPTFATTIRYGDSIVSPSGTFIINGNQTLNTGVNYFWLTYDITTLASGNADAECTQIMLDGIAQIPNITAPTGESNILGSMTGAYTVGSGGDFPDLYTAFTAANTVGLSGNVSLKIISDITEPSMAILNQWTETGSGNYTMTIYPSGGAALTISGNIPLSVIKLHGADRVTIDGLNLSGNSLKIQNTSTTAQTSAVWIASLGVGSGSTDNIIKNCTLMGGTGFTANIYGIIVSGTSTTSLTTSTGGNNNITVQNNIIKKVNTGIYIAGYTTPNTNINILSNTIGSDVSSEYVGSTGINLQYIANGTVSQNHIYNLASTNSSQSVYGISLTYSDTSIIVSKNRIHTLSFIGTNTTTATIGIYVYQNPHNISLINNMIYDFTNIGSTSTSTPYYVSGIQVYGGYNHSILHNTINLSGSLYNTAVAAQSCAVSLSATVYNMDFRNNILSNTMLGTAPKLYTLWVASSSTFARLNNNDYFNFGSSVFGYYNGLDRANFTDWEAASLLDSNSLNVAPIFMSTSDVHIDSQFELYHTGSSTSVVDDIDGDARFATPCIGADEYLVPDNDLRVSAIYTLGKLPLSGGAPHKVVALIRNSGLLTQVSKNIGLSITGANTFSDSKFISTIAPGEVDTIVFDNFTPSVSGNNNVNVNVPSDDVLANNQKNFLMQTNANEFAYADTSSITGSFGFGVNSGYAMAKYYINGTKLVYSSKAYIIGSATVGQTLYGVVMSAAGAILDTSYHKVIQASDLNTWVSFNFVHPFASSTTNNYVYVGVAQMAGLTVSYNPIGCQTEAPTRVGAYYYSNGTTINLVSTTQFGRFAINAIIGNHSAFDASTLAIVNPSTGCTLNNQEVSLNIRNEGLNSLSSGAVTAKYVINDNYAGVVSQSVNMAFTPNQTNNFNFSTLASLPAPTADITYIIKAWTELSGDTISINDTVIKTVISKFTPPPPTVVSPVSVNYTATASLSGSSANYVQWFQNVTDTIPVGSGTSYTTPVLYNNVTYYAASSPGLSGTTNSALMATASQSSGGTGTSGPSNYNDNIIPAATGSPQGWVSTNGWIMYSWNNPISFNKVVFYKSSSSTMTNCTFQYWDGTAFVDFYNYYNLSVQDSVTFLLVTTTKLRFLNITGSTASPNFREIQVISPTSGGCLSTKVPVQVNVQNIPPIDAGAFQVVGPDTVFSSASANVVVRIKNFGTNHLTSATIGWSINGVTQTPYAWIGNLAQGQITSPITINNHNFGMPSRPTIKAWTYNPNGATDVWAINDTVSRVVYVRFGGTYTIGTSGADFTSFTQVTGKLDSAGVGAPVIFNVKPGTYSGQVILKSYGGTDAVNTITFQSESGDSTSVILRDATNSSTNNYTLQLNGAQWIRIRKMTIENYSTVYAVAIDFYNSANNNIIANNVILSSTATASTAAGIYSRQAVTTNENYNIIENNLIRNGAYGIYWFGYYSGGKEVGNIIRNNIIRESWQFGIQAYYQDGDLITNNDVANRTGAGLYYGIESGYNDNEILSKNKVNLYAGSGGGTIYGIRMYNNNSTTGNGLVANNFVSISGLASTYGISNNYGKNLKYYHNSVNLKSGDPATSFAFYCQAPASSGVNIYNNIFMNTGGGYAFGVLAPVTAVDSANNNDLLATGSYFANWGGDPNGNYNPGNVANLAALRTASGRNLSSVSIDPLFTDTATNNLHSNNPFLNHKGKNVVALVPDDIDGELRSTFPTLGADEFLLFRTINLHLFLEGLFNSTSNTLNEAFDGNTGEPYYGFGQGIVDRIDINLFEENPPYAPIGVSVTGIDLSPTGFATFNVSPTHGGNYYIKVSNRNHLSTWTSIAVPFNTETIDWDFTTASLQAYGSDPQVQVSHSPDLFAFYLGDLDQNGWIDASDFNIFEPELTAGSTGFYTSDFDGGGWVDAVDFNLFEPRITAGNAAEYPGKK